MKNYKLTIQGMHCSSCAANVERSIKKVPGVQDASISLLLKSGKVSCSDNVGEDDLKMAVKRAGYTVQKVEQK